MTNQQAERKAKKLLGAKFYIRSGQSMSSQRDRDKNRETYQTARAEIESIESDIKQRLLQLDWYQEGRARQKALRKEADKAQGNALYHRFSVGKSNSLFTEILGSGDTWEEAFAQAEKRL